MKKIVLITLFFAQILVAQPGDLSIDLQQISQSDINWEMILTMNAPAGTQSGFMIQMPASIKMVPVSVRINQADWWLLNTAQVSESDSVVSWVFMPDGVSFLFRDGQLVIGDEIEIKAVITMLQKTEISESAIRIRAVQAIEADIQVSDEVITSTDISSMLSR